MKRRLSMEICILAGGLSSRMGRDKTKIRINGRTFLTHIKTVAQSTSLPVRIIRRDIVARCGPLGGVYTALKSTKADAILFLACDMPFITGGFLDRLKKKLRARTAAIFTCFEGKAGFPFILRSSALPVVEEQLRRRSFSLNALAETTRAKSFRSSRKEVSQLFNINTPEDWEKVRELLKGTPKKPLRLTCKIA